MCTFFLLQKLKNSFVYIKIPGGFIIFSIEHQ